MSGYPEFAVVSSEILPNCLPRIFCTVSSVVCAFHIMPTLIFVTSTCVGEDACVCLLTCSMNLPVGESFTVAQHCPSFYPRIHSLELMSFASRCINLWQVFFDLSLSLWTLFFALFPHFFTFATYHLHIGVYIVQFTPYFFWLLFC